MLETIDHVGIAVRDLDAAISVYMRLCGRRPVRREVVERDGVEAVLFEVGASRIELLTPMHGASAISGFLSRRGEGLHHVAYGVSDIQPLLDDFAAGGMRLLDTCPRAGAGGRMVAFLHPSSAIGVLTELCAIGLADDRGGEPAA